MSGMLSLRVTKEERKRLLALKTERGFKSVADLMRSMLGFPAWSGGEGFEGSDDIENVDKLCKLNLAVVDRVEALSEVVYRLAKQAGLQEVRHQPIAVLEQKLNGDAPFETRGGQKHPVLPDGFSRG